MTLILKQITLDYHYEVLYNGDNLGDIHFEKELQICTVRFYGWSIGGISVSDLAEIVTEIKILEQEIKDRTQ